MIGGELIRAGGRPMLLVAGALLLVTQTGGAPTSSSDVLALEAHVPISARQLQQATSLRVNRQASQEDQVDKLKVRKPTDKPNEKKNKKKPGKGRALAECLEAHNKFRKQHGVPDLSWDAKIAEFAQKRSNHIAKSDGAEFGHPPDLPFGENLFWHSNVNTSCEHMVRGWYDEIGLYDFKAPTFAPATGHFTQLIWRNTTRVGCAFATSSGPNGGIYLTCNYDPPGNFVGEFDENVPRLLGVNVGVDRPATTLRPASTSTSVSTSTSTSTLATTSSTTKGPAQGETSKPKNKNKKKGKGKKKKKKSNTNKIDEEKKKKNENKKKNKKKKSKKKSTSTTVAPNSSTASTRQR